MSWLAASILLSALLTVVLNVVLRAFPGTRDAMHHRLDHPADGDEHRARVWFPWKGMLIASLVLTVVVNVVLLVS